MNSSQFKKNILSKLIDKQITEVIAGGSNGSIITLCIGNAEFSLEVKCVWRLEQGDSVLTGWNESNNAENGNLTKHIKKLAGETIKAIEMNDFFDVKLHFFSNKILNIFCDITPFYELDSYDENWIFCDLSEDICFIVNRNFFITKEKYW